jgi:hypothetical protein
MPSGIMAPVLRMMGRQRQDKNRNSQNGVGTVLRNIHSQCITANRHFWQKYLFKRRKMKINGVISNIRKEGRQEGRSLKRLQMAIWEGKRPGSSRFFFFYSYMHTMFGSFLPPSPCPLPYPSTPFPSPHPLATQQKLSCPYL